jgi:hypothetical protein
MAAPRVLGFNKRVDNAAAIEARLQAAGYQARNVAITDDLEGDARLLDELRAADYDAVAIGAFINGQHPELAASEQTTAWFNRVLNLIHQHAPGAKIVLIRKPSEAVAAVERILGSAASG